MANFYPYNYGYPLGSYTQPVPDQLAQLRMQQQTPPGMAAPMMPAMQAQQPVMSPASPEPPGAPNGIVWVSGKQEADHYFVAANSAVALWDAYNPVIYLRKADSTGKPSTVVYDLVERTDQPPAPAAPTVDLSQFVTWDKLEEVLSERLKKPAKTTKPKEDAENA